MGWSSPLSSTMDYSTLSLAMGWSSPLSSTTDSITTLHYHWLWGGLPRYHLATMNSITTLHYHWLWAGIHHYYTLSFNIRVVQERLALFPVSYTSNKLTKTCKLYINIYTTLKDQPHAMLYQTMQ